MEMTWLWEVLCVILNLYFKANKKSIVLSMSFNYQIKMYVKCKCEGVCAVCTIGENCTSFETTERGFEIGLHQLTIDLSFYR